MRTFALGRRSPALIAGAAAVAALALGGCGGSSASAGSGGGSGSSGSSGGNTVRVAGATTLEASAPFIVAQARGYFRKEGLNIEQTHLAAGQDAIPLLASDKVDVAIGGVSAGMLNAVHQGLKFKYVAELSRTRGTKLPSTAQVDVGKQSGVKTIAQLKGKKIAVSGGNGATGSLFLATVLKRAGLSLKDVDVENVDFPEMETALKSGADAAALVTPPFSTKMQADGVATAITAASAGIAGIAALYNEHFAESPLAQKFFDALVHGAQDLQGGKVKSPQNLQAIAKASGENIATLKASPTPVYPADQSPDSKTLEDAQQAFLGAGLLNYSTPADMSTLRDDSFAKKASAGQ